MSLIYRCTVCDAPTNTYGGETRCDRCKLPCPTCDGDVAYCQHPLPSEQTGSFSIHHRRDQKARAA